MRGDACLTAARGAPAGRPARVADLAILAVAMLLPTLVTWLYFIALANRSAAAQQGVYVVGKLIQFGMPVVWVLWVRRERLPLGRPTGAGLPAGLAFGALATAAMLAGYFLWLGPAGVLAPAGEAVRAKLAGFGIRGLAGFAALGAVYSLGHSLLEEYYWRWFVFGRLRASAGWPAAAAVSSLAFTGHHVLLLGTYFGWASPWTWLFSLAVAVGGAVWAWIYQRSGSLLGPWLSHLLVDAGIFIVGWHMARL